MDDVTLMAKLKSGETVYVSPMHDQTYAEYVESDNLGGSKGYFISRECRGNFEVLAKAASFDAAQALFKILVGSQRYA
jgi:hypothetical protein